METYSLLLLPTMLVLVNSLPVSSSPCLHNITKTENIWNCSRTFPSDFPPPSSVPNGVSTYDLSHNQLLEIHRINSSCSSYSTCKGCLKHLLLHHNEIDVIVNHAFLNLHCLHSLDLSYNNIHGGDLSEMTFEGLLQLKLLSLKGNPLGILKDFTLKFNELRLLQVLDLSDCELTHIGDHAFDDIQLLEKIDLSGNKLKTVDPRMFTGLHFVGTLDISKNELVTINSRNFYPMLRLQKLYLDHNNIQSVPDDAFKGMTNLEILSISENQFKEIPYNAMKDILGLRIFNISRNPFVKLTASNWPQEIKLGIHELYMDEMGDGFSDIQYKAFSAMPVLKKVSISGNKNLVSIAHNAFQDSSGHLEEVDLVDNGLGFLAPHLLPWRNLEVLELAGNPWNCDCKLRWILEERSFQNSTIRCYSPEKLRNRILTDLSPLDLRCPRSLVWILLTFIAATSGVFIIVMGVFAWKKRDRLPCRRVKGRYVSVYTKDTDESEGTATITNAHASDHDDELPLQNANV